MITNKFYKIITVSYEDSGYFYIQNIGDETGVLVFRDRETWTNHNTNLEYSADGVNWINLPFNYLYRINNLNLGDNHGLDTTIRIAPGRRVYFRGNNPNGWGWNWGIQAFQMDVPHIVGGNALSLIDYNNMDTITTLPNYAFGCPNWYGLFYNNKGLVDASKLNFGNVTTMGSSALQGMFYGCTSLVNVPELPATTLATNCYREMFRGCTSLVNAPELPATDLVQSCYQYMFYNCPALNKVITYAQDISASNCLNQWLYGVASTGDFYNLGGATYSSDTSGIPSGWTEHTTL